MAPGAGLTGMPLSELYLMMLWFDIRSAGWGLIDVDVEDVPNEAWCGSAR